MRKIRISRVLGNERTKINKDKKKLMGYSVNLFSDVK